MTNLQKEIKEWGQFRQLALYLLIAAKHDYYPGKSHYEEVDGKSVRIKCQGFVSRGNRTFNIPYDIDNILTDLGKQCALGLYYEHKSPEGIPIYSFQGFYNKYGYLPYTVEDWQKMQLTHVEKPVIYPDFCQFRLWLTFKEDKE